LAKPVNPAWRQPTLQQGQQGRGGAVESKVTASEADIDDVTCRDSAPSQAAITSGRYRIERELGRGGMGVVYRAYDTIAGRTVALKVLVNDAATEAIVDRFLVEAKIGLSLVDEHVCRLFDVGVDPVGGKPYMAMELLEGQDLDTLLVQRGGSLPLEEACEYVLSACAGLATAHAIGVVHRDVKLSNLFLAIESNGAAVLKILDFGVSKAPGFGNATRMTQTGEIVGTPFYMAPEQVRSARSVDARADVWSLGIVLYELLCGEPPFDALSTTDLFAALLTRPHVPLSERRSDLPDAIGDVVDVALRKDRDRRFASVVAMARALATFTPRGAELFEKVRSRAAAGTVEPAPRTSRT
jgi:eukaryotic-like serine/threonine-protein kinase